MRVLKRTDAGFETSSKESLCSECSLDCGYKKSVQICQDMRPVLPIKWFDGTDQKLFNTMRLHSAWHKRLKPGDVITLESKGERREFAVVMTVAGEFDDVFLEHCEKNHMAIANKEEHYVPVVYDALVKSYGKNWVLKSNKLTAIYLTPIEDM